MNLDLHGQTVLVTGATGSLGTATALACARAGAEVVLLDRNERALDALYDRMIDEGLVKPAICPLDLAQFGQEQADSLVGMLESDCIGLTGLIHCASAFPGLQPLDQVTALDWHRVMQVNLNAAWLLSMSCLPLLRAAPRGSICFTLDEQVREQSAYWGPYGISKAAVRSLAAILTEEFRETSMRVFGIDPGPFRSELRSRAFLAENPADLHGPEAAAELIAGLVGPQSALVSGCYAVRSGELLPLDG